MAIKRFLMILGLILLAVSKDAWSQSPSGTTMIRSLASCRPMLLQAISVQKELGLSIDQIDQSVKLAADFQKEVERRQAASGPKPELPQGLSPGERYERLREATGRASKIAGDVEREFITKMDLILEPDQARRLEQIQIQSVGTAALQLDFVATKLDLKTAQKEAFRTLETQYGKAMAEAIESTKSSDGTQYAVVARQARERLEKSMISVLTPEQKEKFDEIRGKPFDLSTLRQLAERSRVK
jgi:hypothetical protein